MKDFNRILALTKVQGGVCINDPFISLVNDLSDSIRKEVDYITFDKNPINEVLTDSVEKDTLDTVLSAVSDHDFILVDTRLDFDLLNLSIGFILSSGNQVGSFLINDPELQEFVESKVLLRKDHSPENFELLTVCPDDVISEEAIQISNALDNLVKDNYNKIKFVSGVYKEDILYKVLGYCYSQGTIVIDSNLPDDPFIKIIASKW